MRDGDLWTLALAHCPPGAGTSHAMLAMVLGTDLTTVARMHLGKLATPPETRRVVAQIAGEHGETLMLVRLRLAGWYKNESGRWQPPEGSES